MVRHQSCVVAVLATVFLGGLPVSTEAQLVRPPNPNAPMLVVVTFKSADKKLGVDFAASVRDRIEGDVSYRDLQVQSKANIDATLQASGYDMTAALTEGDANLLAKQLRADEYIEGTINKSPSGTGYAAEAWMVLTYDQNQVQPLGTFSAVNPKDIAKQISSSFQAAQKVYDEVQKCRSARREEKTADVMSAATSGIAKYPKSSLLRNCELQSMVDAKKAPADILKVAGEILEIDPKSKLALQAQVDAYDQLAEQASAAHDSSKAAGYKDKKMSTLANLLAADPTNTKLQQSVTYELAQAGKYGLALTIIKKAVDDNPGDVTFTKLYWQLLYATKDYKNMVKVGDDMVKMDTSFADTTYFDRTIDAYRTDSQYAQAVAVASRATQKYPKRADYWAQRGSLELKSGQVQPAIISLKRALDIDPKIEGARMLIITSLVDAGQFDSAFVAMHDALKAGENANDLAQRAVIVGNRLFKLAQDSTNKEAHTVAGFQRGLPWMFWADSISSDRGTKNNAKFLLGVSHFFIAQMMYPEVVAQKSCDGAKTVQDVIVNSQLELPVGGATNPDLVKQLMPFAMQMGTAVESAVKAFCTPPKKP